MTDSPKKTHGGAREGAGRPKKAAVTVEVPPMPAGATAAEEAAAFLRAVMLCDAADIRDRINAAKALRGVSVPIGIKASAMEAARAASTGRFGIRPAPTGAGIKDQRQRDALAPSGTGWDDLLDPEAPKQ